MKQLHVFYRIFHDDLIPSPTIKQTQLAEYKNYIEDNLAYDDCCKLFESNDYDIKFRFYELLLKNNIGNFKSWLYQQVFVEMEDEQSIKKLIKKCQVYIKTHLDKIRLECLSDDDHKTVFTISESKTVVDIYKLIYQSFVSLHDYLENTFNYYLDEHIVVPCKQRKQFIGKYEVPALNILRSIKHFNANPKIIAQITEVLHRFLNDDFTKFTYSQMTYCEAFFSKLENFICHATNKTEEELLIVLVQFNFNRIGVFHYLLTSFRSNLNRYSSRTDKLLYLHKRLKHYNQMQVCSKCSYNKKSKPLHVLCIEWLEHEIETLSILTPSVKETENGAISNSKISIDLSVGEIALVLKLLQETKLISASKSTMFRVSPRASTSFEIFFAVLFL